MTGEAKTTNDCLKTCRSVPVCLSSTSTSLPLPYLLLYLTSSSLPSPPSLFPLLLLSSLSSSSVHSTAGTNIAPPTSNARTR
eukprot:765572-Hanusia_phi.AAC.4